MKTAELRQCFLDYFKNHQHTIVPTSPLVPGNDPTLLFTNAGMVQFKEVFTGIEKRPYTRATTVQRCVRAGGKHNDLENVGFTARHHTFFEMLGNFSFGDYFKKEAIEFAWHFLTKELGLSPEKLWVTVYKDDKEAEDIWFNEIKIDKTRFSRCGDKDNFWSMGDTGPCGPCTEIFYDHGEGIAGGPPGSPDEDGDRYIEIWNLVFMQYDRQKDGELKPLPKPSVDTGMGLERIAAIMQNAHSNYDIDLFQSLIKSIAAIAGSNDLDHNSMRVIADHIRSCAFLIIDGVTPSNEGRGYVLRRIIRRAIRHGNTLGIKEAFFYKLVEPLIKEMGQAYPELKKSQAIIEKILLKEEQQFAETLEHGLRILEQDISALKGNVISGETVFKLYDTYGFPDDLTQVIAKEKGLDIDHDAFKACMTKQRERSQAASNFDIDYSHGLSFDIETKFTGYDTLLDKGSIVDLIKDNKEINTIAKGDEALIISGTTPFYAESGGQVGDRGEIRHGDNIFIVKDTQKVGDAYMHIGVVKQGKFNKGDDIDLHVDLKNRQATKLHHSATHLLHAALKKELGEHVMQKGSLVDPQRLRFDFSHFESLKADELQRIENLVNEQIRKNHPVDVQLMSPDEAKKSGALALFGEKYGDEVRVLTMGDFSKELCGGTHVSRTGDIGLLKITSEAGVAAGIRRIEAVAGERALNFLEEKEAQLLKIAKLIKAKPADVVNKVDQLHEQNKKLEKELQKLKLKLASDMSGDLLSHAQDINGVKILSQKLDGVDPKSLRDTLDQLKSKMTSAIIVLATVKADNKVSLIAGVTKDLTKKVKAGELVNFVAQQVGGKGGGRPDMAQAGGDDAKKLPAALDSVHAWVAEKL